MAKTVTLGKLVAVKLCESLYAKEGQTAVHLQQEVTTSYGAGDEFGGASLVGAHTEYTTSRNVVIPCSIDDDVATVQRKLDDANLKLIRVISSEPIVQEKHRWALNNTDLTIDDIAQKQLIPMMDSDGDAMVDSNGMKIPMLDANGNPQYRIFSLATPDIEDIDSRIVNPVSTPSSVNATEDAVQAFDM